MYLEGKKLTKSKNYLNLGKYYHLIAYYHENRTLNLDSAYYYNIIAKNEFSKINDNSRIGRRLLRAAIIERLKNDNIGAKETLTKAISYLDKNRDKNYIASLYNELAINNSELENKKIAIDYYLKALELSSEHEDVLTYKNNLAKEYSELGDFSKAISIFNEILSDSALIENPKNYARVIHNHAFSNWLEGKTGFHKNMLKAVSIRKDRNDKEGLIGSYIDLARFYEKAKTKKSISYLDTVISLSKELGKPKSEVTALKLLLNLLPKDIDLKNRYIFLKDSIETENLKAKTNFAFIKYNSDITEKRLSNLEKRRVEERAQLAEQKTQKVIFLSLSGFLLLSGISLYFVLGQRHKKEKFQEVYNTEKRISQDLHDGLANDVFGLMTKVQIQNKGNEDLINRLENIYQTTRQISHENAAIKTGIYFKDELNDLIGNYQDDGTTLLIKGINTVYWSQLSEHKCVIVHRCIKELLVNMKKHAQASLASLQFENKKNDLIISYSDNGIGFGPKMSNGKGLMNTENRIRSIGGDLIFENKQGHGAKVIISIPL
ncbi:tetratricopeptide repeat protein [Maribacter sp. 2304DJ31-5]|uniref:ATP-binding protein n=1 Tax=Maribacter sp. 2304DJ31-5 TaxID=3386273 RepID=UPI0039BD470F